jgi:DNA-binding transcriptional regulator YiaG
MARERPRDPYVVSSIHSRRTTEETARPEVRAGLTPAEMHALRRSAPLTPAQFTELRSLADKGVSPLRFL